MLDRYGNEIIMSDELKEVIDNIKELPEDKIREGLSLLSYIFPKNIIYFGYLNKCYELEDMKKMEEFFGCYCYFIFKNYDDYINLFNNILDKLGLIEEVYSENKEYMKQINKIMLDAYNARTNNKNKSSLENRNELARINYYSDIFDPYEINEYINNKNYYFATLKFEYVSYNDTPYQILDYYVYKKYTDEYEKADNENLLMFEKLYKEFLKDYKYSIETTEENQVFIFLEDTKKEETDYLEYVSDDEEDKIIFFSNNISIILELANKLSEYFENNEMEYRSIIDG